jgi:hypothetical protein
MQPELKKEKNLKGKNLTLKQLTTYNGAGIGDYYKTV